MDNNLFTKLYQQYFNRVKRIARYYVKSLEDAEDIAQEVFIKAYLNYDSRRNKDAPVLAWLSVICKHECFTFLREKKKLESVDIDTYRDLEYSDALRGRDLNIEEKMIADEMISEIRPLIKSLPSYEQVPTRLGIDANLTPDQIADILSKPVKNVRRYIKRGKQKIFKHITA
jgi:RNA polymerase sigma-70 factor (ECF subfamily)